jgi:hypothetical protein
MNIVFICGSLEPGKDGIGDYVRTIAGQLVKAGGSCLLISWHDRLVSGRDTQIACYRSEKNLDIVEMRLSNSLSTISKAHLIRPVLDEFNPDLVSIQYNPYSYHVKGLPSFLARDLLGFLGGHRLHVMFHELWCDWSLPVSLRAKLYGVAQRFIARDLYSTLKPVACHTSNGFYKEKLFELGISASIFPVFSNIKIADLPVNSRHWLTDFLDLGCVENPYVLGLFGEQQTPPRKAAVEELRSTIFKFQPSASICLAVCGRHTARSLSYTKKLAELLEVAVPPIYLGFLSNDLLSHFLSSIDCGISMYPVELAGKSGALAACLEHETQVALVGHNLNSDHACHMLLPGQLGSSGGCQAIAHKLLQLCN